MNTKLASIILPFAAAFKELSKRLFLLAPCFAPVEKAWLLCLSAASNSAMQIFFMIGLCVRQYGATDECG
jgi:hypothetical protein